MIGGRDVVGVGVVEDGDDPIIEAANGILSFPTASGEEAKTIFSRTSKSADDEEEVNDDKYFLNVSSFSSSLFSIPSPTSSVYRRFLNLVYLF